VGQDAQADFTLPMQRAFKIRGSIANFAQYRTVTFELLSGVEDVSANRVALNSSQGRFEIQDVVQGFTVCGQRKERIPSGPGRKRSFKSRRPT